MKTKSIIAALLAVILTISLFPVTVFAEENANAVSYVDAEGKEHELDTEPTEITGNTVEWSGWMIAYGDVKIKGQVKLKSDTNLILADGATLTVNGTLGNHQRNLNIYAQSTGDNVGILKVIGALDRTSYSAGLRVNTTVMGGIINIDGGKNEAGNPANGIFHSMVNVAGGVLNVKGGNGRAGAYNSAITVSGGELIITGGKGSVGIASTGITVTSGSATVFGGDIEQKAFSGDYKYNDADILGSNDGKSYKLIDSESIEHYYSLKFLPKGTAVEEPDEEPIPETENKETETTVSENNQQAAPEKTPANPETGDRSNITLWIVLLAVSSTMVAVCLTFKKRKLN